MPFLRRAWTGEPFEHNGTTVRVTPRPFQDPMPIYLGGGASRRSIERAAAIGRRLLRAGDAAAVGGLPQSSALRWASPIRASGRRVGRSSCGSRRRTRTRRGRRLAPHIRHQIDSYGQWTKAGLGTATGPYIPTNDTEVLRQGGAYQVVTPDEAVELAATLGPQGELHLNPLLAGIDPQEAWAMLRTFEREVLPHIGTRESGPLPSGS